LIALQKFPALKALYINNFIRNFALNLFSIFEPLFVASLFGFSKEGIVWAIAYFIGIRVSLLITTLPAAKLIEKWGFRRCMLLGTGLILLKFGVLYLSQQNPAFLVLASLLTGISVPLYWIPHHLIVAEDSDDAWFGKEVSFLKLLSRFAAMLSPVIGGLIIGEISYSALFLVVAASFILSFAPLGLMGHHKIHKAYKLYDVFKGILDKKRRKEWISLFSAGIHDSSEDLVWTFVMFFVLSNIESLGALKSAATLVMLLSIYIAGKVMDKTRKAGKLLIFASRFDSLLWASRFFVTNIITLSISEFFVRISRGLLWTPFDAIMYHKARGSDSGAFFYLLRREFVLNGGRLFGLLLILLLVVSGLDIRYGVFLGALASFFIVPRIPFRKVLPSRKTRP
jgi:hypothetical protein